MLERAQRENRVVLTFDKDFSELAIRRQIPAVSGIILLRIAAPSSAILASMVVTIPDDRDNWPGHFSVIERNHIRMIPLPLKS